MGLFRFEFHLGQGGTRAGGLLRLLFGLLAIALAIALAAGFVAMLVAAIALASVYTIGRAITRRARPADACVIEGSVREKPAADATPPRKLPVR